MALGIKVKNFSLSLTTKREFDKQINELLSANPSQPVFVNVTEKKKKRSIPANNQYYVWMPDISNFICEDLRTTRNILKLDFGLPIILACEQIGQRYGERLQAMNFFNFTREQLIGYVDGDGEWQNGIIEMIQVTSLMNTKQHNLMRDNILYFYNQAGLNIGYEN